MNSKDKMFTVMGVVLALQGFFPDTFAWPTDSVGWVRFMLGLVGVVLTAIAGTNVTGPADPPKP